MARDYELGIVINPEVGDEQARAIVERITQAILANDGQVMRVNAWGRRRLAYPIQHHRDGLYFFYDLVMPPTAVTEIERTIRVTEEIVRHLLKVRDPRAAEQARQREAEAEARAAEARAVAEAAQAAHAAAQAAQAQAHAEAEAEAAQAAATEQAPAETTAPAAPAEAESETPTANEQTNENGETAVAAPAESGAEA